VAYTNTSVDADWLKLVGSRILFELDPKKPVLYIVPVESILGIESASSQWSLLEILGLYPTVRALSSLARSQTARQALETAALCGMLTHGPWAGPARRNWIIK
jgi:hypothetical protein